MKNIFSRLTPTDFKEADELLRRRSLVVEQAPPPPKPVSDTVVGSVVVMLDKSYQTYLQRRVTLEAEIARSQEALRQTNTVISSLEAALTTASLDPALTQEEADKAQAPLVDRRAVYSGGDQRTEPSMGFEVGPLKEPAPPMHWYDADADKGGLDG